MRTALAILGATLVMFGGVPAQAAAAANDTIGDFRVIASPFTSSNVSTRHAAGVRLYLRRGARVSVTIEQPGGAIVRRLASGQRLAAGGHRWAWAGRANGGAFVPDGEYRAHVVVRNGLGTDERALALRKGMPAIYAANPGAITVLINPGHGGGYSGAVSQGVFEKDVNLDVGLRLRRLLQAAGVHVVMTRTMDSDVNLPRVDVNGDGAIGRTTPGGDDWDELAARIDIGNEARADVHIFNHNNAAGCRCLRGTETYTGMNRIWTPEGVALATFVQTAQMAQLETFRDADYHPIDRGVKPGNYYTVSPYSPYDPPLLPRPTMMPTLLTESLFVNDPVERELLRRSAVRETIAIAIYVGIADYLATREYGIHYELVSAPSQLPAGGSADYQVLVTNTGNVASAGWQLQLHSVPAVPEYDGSGATGDLLGSAGIPDGLAPGATAQVAVHATAPSAVGTWLVKADVFIGGSERPFLSERGVVALQVPLTTEP